ncbi:TPA: hypothetical protein ACPUKY_004619 [Klebsiella pneumoniae]
MDQGTIIPFLVVKTTPVNSYKDTSSAMMIGTMQNDPMFSFMLAVHTAAGSEAYKTVVGAAGNHVDCENPLNWIKLTQQAIKGGKV